MFLLFPLLRNALHPSADRAVQRGPVGGGGGAVALPLGGGLALCAPGVDAGDLVLEGGVDEAVALEGRLLLEGGGDD